MVSCRTPLFFIRLGLSVLLAVGPLQASQVTESYIGPASGDWNTASHWSIPGTVPSNFGGTTYSVHIATTASATVSLDINATIDNLTIDVGDALALCG